MKEEGEGFWQNGPSRACSCTPPVASGRPCKRGGGWASLMGKLELTSKLHSVENITINSPFDPGERAVGRKAKSNINTLGLSLNWEIQQSGSWHGNRCPLQASNLPIPIPYKHQNCQQWIGHLLVSSLRNELWKLLLIYNLYFYTAVLLITADPSFFRGEGLIIQKDIL